MLTKTRYSLFIFIALIITAAALLGPKEGGAGTTTAGTIFACWSNACPSPPSGTVTIDLIGPDGSSSLGQCQLTVERSCCRIDGDFPTGTYFFKYSQASSSGPCYSPTFSYTNGKSQSEPLICNCP
jgi:hypothetical protein